jgi:hypothetical protein
MALLTSEPLDLGDGNALYTNLGKGLPNIIELERLDDCSY